MATPILCLQKMIRPLSLLYFVGNLNEFFWIVAYNYLPSVTQAAEYLMPLTTIYAVDLRSSAVTCILY